MNFIRLVRKKLLFWSLKSCFFFSSFMRAVRKKTFFQSLIFFLQSHACMNFIGLVRKKQFFGA